MTFTTGLLWVRFCIQGNRFCSLMRRRMGLGLAGKLLEVVVLTRLLVAQQSVTCRR